MPPYSSVPQIPHFRQLASALLRSICAPASCEQLGSNSSFPDSRSKSWPSLSNAVASRSLAKSCARVCGPRTPLSILTRCEHRSQDSPPGTGRFGRASPLYRNVAAPRISVPRSGRRLSTDRYNAPHFASDSSHKVSPAGPYRLCTSIFRGPGGRCGEPEPALYLGVPMVLTLRNLAVLPFESPVNCGPGISQTV